MRYRILGDRVKLYDSFLVPKSKFGSELDKILHLHPSCRLWYRSDKSIRREIAAHNLLYALHIRRSKTKDTDLEFEPKWYMNLAYAVVGTIALWVIK